MLTLLFSKEESIQVAVFECYKDMFFGEKTSSDLKVRWLLSLLRGASLGQITCIEELLKKCVLYDTLEQTVFTKLWETYEKRPKGGQNQSQEQVADLDLNLKLDQRNAIKVLRILGTHKIEILVQNKDQLYRCSRAFASADQPDFILLKEALQCFERVLAHQMAAKKGKFGGAELTEQDQHYLKEMINVMIRTFGTGDMEWVEAAETLLNAVFNLKTKNSPEFAKLIIQRLTHQLVLTQNKSDSQFTQLFFVVGHTAIKMLTFVEQMDNELKKSGSEAFSQKGKRESEENK